MSPSIFKKRGPSTVVVKNATKQEISSYIQILSTQSYVVMGTPIEFRVSMDVNGLRNSAKDYAYKNGCSLVVEISDPNPMVNPFNPYKYYLFQYQGNQPQPPVPVEPPSRGGTTAQQQLSRQGGQQAQLFACPYCHNQFSSYVNPGQNIIVCNSCGGQSMVDIPALQEEGSPQAGTGQGSMDDITLRGRYNTNDELIIDCLEVLGKIAMVEGNPIPFEDTGEFLYPFVRMKKTAYQHIGFRNMDVILLKEAIHDFKVSGVEEHTQSQANVNPHKDELFAIKTLGGVHFLVLEEFKRLEDDQKVQIANSVYGFLSRFVRIGS